MQKITKNHKCFYDETFLDLMATQEKRHIESAINVNGTNLGIIGKLHPSIAKDDIYVIEINLAKLLNIKTARMKYKEISKFPGIVKDVAFIIDNDKTNQEIETAIKKAGGKLLNKVKVFDIYNNIEENKKSIAYKLTFQEQERTLTEEEVMEVFNKIIKEVQDKCSAKVRDK